MGNIVFKRGAFSPVDKGRLGEQDNKMSALERASTFTGGDIVPYINNVQVGNLESVTWSSSVETVGVYGMGRRDPYGFTKGKRAIVGSLVFTQLNQHVLLEQVFDITGQNRRTLGDIWSSGDLGSNVTASKLANSTNVSVVGRYGTSNKGIGTENPSVDPYINNTISMGLDYNLRGLSPTDFANQLNAQIKWTAQLVAAQIIRYADQLPPFDLTLVGVNKFGDASRAILFGVEISNETSGFSMTDLGNSVGMSFVAAGVEPWRPITATEGSAWTISPFSTVG